MFTQLDVKRIRVYKKLIFTYNCGNMENTSDSQNTLPNSKVVDGEAHAYAPFWESDSLSNNKLVESMRPLFLEAISRKVVCQTADYVVVHNTGP